jgi:hypothetical protein
VDGSVSFYGTPDAKLTHVNFHSPLEGQITDFPPLHESILQLALRLHYRHACAGLNKMVDGHLVFTRPSGPHLGGPGCSGT